MRLLWYFTRKIWDL